MHVSLPIDLQYSQQVLSNFENVKMFPLSNSTSTGFFRFSPLPFSK